MSKRKPKKRRSALKPDCFDDPHMFELRGAICPICPFYHCCGALKFGPDFLEMIGTNRGVVENYMAQKLVPYREAVNTIATLFGVSDNAASLSYSRKKRTVR